MTGRTPKIAALLPMKGHSERVPNKNLRELGGKPLFFWVLETLVAVPEIDTIVINTDSDAIAAAATEAFDVVIHRRPEGITGDFVSMNRIIAHDIARLDSHDLFLQTHATNPFLGPESVRQAIARLLSNPEYDSLFAVTRFHGRFYFEDGAPVNHNPDELLRTQDLPALLFENSNLYLFTREAFKKRGNRIGPNALMHELAPTEAMDIDTEADWRLAEHIAAAGMG